MIPKLLFVEALTMDPESTEAAEQRGGVVGTFIVTK